MSGLVGGPPTPPTCRGWFQQQWSTYTCCCMVAHTTQSSCAAVCAARCAEGNTIVLQPLLHALACILARCVHCATRRHLTPVPPSTTSADSCGVGGVSMKRLLRLLLQITQILDGGDPASVHLRYRARALTGVAVLATSHHQLRGSHRDARSPRFGGLAGTLVLWHTSNGHCTASQHLHPARSRQNVRLLRVARETHLCRGVAAETHSNPSP